MTITKPTEQATAEATTEPKEAVPACPATCPSQGIDPNVGEGR